jgi:hypothetical protein
MGRCYDRGPALTDNRRWSRRSGALAHLHRVLSTLARVSAGRRPWPSVAVMEAQPARTTGRGGVRGFDGHQWVKRSKCHIPVDALSLLLGVRVGPTNEPDQHAGAALLAGLRLRWPAVRIIFADGARAGPPRAAAFHSVNECPCRAFAPSEERDHIRPGLGGGAMPSAASRRALLCSVRRRP